jgi:glutamine amidotransferase-like uncharacterized protein
MRIGIAVVGVAIVAFAARGLARGDPAPVASVPALADVQNVERNLRWILARERAGEGAGASVGVYADLGAWHTGARSLVDALEKAGLACRALDRALLTPDGLKGLKALVLPGGWAPFQRDTLGTSGLATVRAFVEQGGRCLGVCAGAYLLARDVRWEGTSFSYPPGLFDGLAEGPVDGLAKPPTAGAAHVTPTEDGKKRGLGVLEGRDVLYYGGPRMVGGSDVKVLATYADGTAAIVSRPVGKGEVVLCGVHLERPAAGGADDGPPFPSVAPALLKALLATPR